MNLTLPKPSKPNSRRETVDKITVVCHKDHVVSYEDYRGQCLLCVVEDLMQEVGRLTAVCKEKEWVGLTDEEIESVVRVNTFDDCVS